MMLISFKSRLCLAMEAYLHQPAVLGKYPIIHKVISSSDRSSKVGDLMVIWFVLYITSIWIVVSILCRKSHLERCHFDIAYLPSKILMIPFISKKTSVMQTADNKNKMVDINSVLPPEKLAKTSVLSPFFRLSERPNPCR